ncbi:MAG: DUF3572 domain-containing protein [Alphaproteobacteria bacterium]
MNKDETAQIVALEVLRFLASDGDRLGRFLAWTGEGPQTLKTRAGDPEFLAGVFDYLLAHESLLIEFAETIEADPASIAPLRRHLPAPDSLG